MADPGLCTAPGPAPLWPRVAHLLVRRRGEAVRDAPRCWALRSPVFLRADGVLAPLSDVPALGGHCSHFPPPGWWYLRGERLGLFVSLLPCGMGQDISKTWAACSLLGGLGGQGEAVVSLPEQTVPTSQMSPGCRAHMAGTRVDVWV